MMETQKAITLFLENCRQRGMALSTIKNYASHLRHFQLDLPDLPIELAPIDRFLTRTIKKESARYRVRKSLLALYSFLEKEKIAQNPIPAGKVGRPKKSPKLGGGGQTTQTESKSTSLSTRSAINDFLASRDIAATTVRWYWIHFTKVLAAFPDELPIEPEPLSKHIYSIKASPEHRHGSYRAIRALYRFLEERHRLPVDPQWGVINPMKLVKAPRVPRKEPASLSLAELQQVADACETPKERALIMLASDCGLRAGEIIGLTLEDIEDDFIRVQGKVGERRVSIHPVVRDFLRSLSPDGGLLFTGDYLGQQYTTASLYHVIKNLVERAGIEKRHMGSHLLRHTFGRQAVSCGLDLITIQQQMGHTSILTTRKYTYLSPEEMHQKHLEKSPSQQLEFFNGEHKNESIEPAPTR